MGAYYFLFPYSIFFQVVCISLTLEWTITHYFTFLCIIFFCMYLFDNFSSSSVDKFASTRLKSISSALAWFPYNSESSGLTPKKKSLYCRIDHSIDVQSVTRNPTHSQHQFRLNHVHWWYTWYRDILAKIFCLEKTLGCFSELTSRSIFACRPREEG